MYIEFRKEVWFEDKNLGDVRLQMVFKVTGVDEMIQWKEGWGFRMEFWSNLRLEVRYEEEFQEKGWEYVVKQQENQEKVEIQREVEKDD